jgi:hypothetical protein
MKITAFWNIVHCSLFEVDRRFRGAYCLHRPFITVRTSETSVYSNETTRRCISEGSHLHFRSSENQKSHILTLSLSGINSVFFAVTVSVIVHVWHISYRTHMRSCVYEESNTRFHVLYLVTAVSRPSLSRLKLNMHFIQPRFFYLALHTRLPQ